MLRQFTLSNDSWPAAMQWDWPLCRRGHDGDTAVPVMDTEKKFKVKLEAAQFTPNDIQVRTIGRFLEVHCERPIRDDGYETSRSRRITRSYRMPLDIDLATLQSYLNGHGQLVIKADKMKLSGDFRKPYPYHLN